MNASRIVCLFAVMVALCAFEFAQNVAPPALAAPTFNAANADIVPYRL